MVRNAPVSVGWQILFSVLPIVWIWAAYRIEKLRMALLVFLPSGFLIGLLIPFPLSLVGIAIPIYFMGRWSKQWNEKLEEPVNQI
jgi:hypothetical protein